MSIAYRYCDLHLPKIFEAVGLDMARGYSGILSAHGDKAQQYEWRWDEAGIPAPHALAMYLLARTERFAPEIDPDRLPVWKWVIDHYTSGHHLISILPPIDQNLKPYWPED